MIERIVCIYEKIHCKNDEYVTLLVDGEIPSNSTEVFEDSLENFRKLGVRAPVKKITTYLVLNDARTIKLPNLVGCIKILADKTGFICINANQKSYLDTDNFFEAPNNAAIYNADGTLRFQLISPEQGKSWYFEYTAENPRDGQFGFLLSNGVDPDLHFCAYDGTAKLGKILFTKERR
jgi:hypothetical protein